jgi:branched-chain amino acid aminotransferase
MSLPTRKLSFPDFDRLTFDVYRTAGMYVACHFTSDDPDENKHWPNPCLDMGWERYYSDDHQETQWRSVKNKAVVPWQNLSLHPATCALHYGAAAFEGTKAFVSARKKIVLFRPAMNARRLQKSASRTLMPKVPVEMFVEAVTETVRANREAIPLYRSENWAWQTRNPQCLYVRPLLMGYGPQLGVRPAKDHLFFVYASPVRSYYPVEGMSVLVTRSFHRAAPGGTGNIKVAGNYASGLLPTQLARRGYDWGEGTPVKVSDKPFHDVLYLDAVHNQYIEEFSGANFLAVSAGGALISPQSDTILPGVTRDAVLTLARDLGLAVEQRPLDIDEVMNEKRIAEIFCAGNAAVVTPIVSIYCGGKARKFQLDKLKTVKRLWDMLVGIQLQTRDDPYGWVQEIG